MDNQVNITPAFEWQKPSEVHTLPSGKVARLKRVSPISIIMRAGNIPDSLAKIAIDAINGAGKKQAKSKTFEFGKNDLGMMADLMDAITQGAFVEPVIVDNPDYGKGQIALSDVDENDKIWVMTWAMNPAGGEAAAAERFPQESQRDVSLAQTG